MHYLHVLRMPAGSMRTLALGRTEGCMYPTIITTVVLLLPLVSSTYLKDVSR